MGLAATSEQGGKHGGDDRGFVLCGRARKEENLTAAKPVRYDLQRISGSQARSVALGFDHVVGQGKARFHDVIFMSSWLPRLCAHVIIVHMLEARLIYSYRPQRSWRSLWARN